ncbi:Nif3-like dinuclear metal center hexameric protein [Desulfobacterales bacterium HSG16]|nr:Nif3-like dinuclear metal center hexameric protein [Desulfobacterales bacterium HSG16]
MKKAIVSDIIGIMEKIAPGRLAEKWDNAGLQIGRNEYPVKKVMIALDALPEVVDEACCSNTDLLITHHPLIFKPIQCLDFSTPLGKLIEKSAMSRLAIFSAHTNLDSVFGGVNDELCRQIGLKNVRSLVKDLMQDTFKLVIYAPEGHEDKILEALFKTCSQKIGTYADCSFRNLGKGTFQPLEGAEPFIRIEHDRDHDRKICQADEVRIETVVKKSEIKKVISEVEKCHPYETMAWDVYPLHSSAGDLKSIQGIGRIGEADSPMPLDKFARHIKASLELSNIPSVMRVVGDPGLEVRTVAVCSGSGAGLLDSFFSSDAMVYISGDLGYHNARDIQAAGRGLVDIGHFASEHLIVAVLRQRLTEMLKQNGFNVEVRISKCEHDPFRSV